MGQTHSTEHRCKLKGTSFKQMRLRNFDKKRLSNSKNLSHTFSLPETTLKPQQLNINTATEEELMTLPGINRNIAVNIVNYRRLIGRFNRIEDVALVSGVGAQKLENIKLELYVAPNIDNGTSSRASTTFDSLGNSESPIDINLASIFDLQTVPGVDQELASRIVEKRIKYGGYHSLDELARLRGMGKHRFATIRPYLKVNGTVMRTPSDESSSPTWNNPEASSTPRLNNIGRKSNRIHQDRQLEYTTLPNQDDSMEYADSNTGITEKEIWELLSIASPRPSIQLNYTHELYDKNSIRIASWNLSNFNVDKASNPGVMEVICRTILENRFSLLAFQEIKSLEALNKLTHELNSPSLKRIKDWRENQRNWHSIYLGAGLAILWDGNPKKNITLTGQPPATKVFLPVLASMKFHIKKIDLTIINVQIHRPDDNSIIERFMDVKNSIFLGDFTLANDALEESDNAMLDTTNTAINSETHFFKDRIILRRGSRKSFDIGMYKIVRQGLTHLGIPQGWRWGGPASEHCPVWCDIFTDTSTAE